MASLYIDMRMMVETWMRRREGTQEMVKRRWRWGYPFGLEDKFAEPMWPADAEAVCFCRQETLSKPENAVPIPS